MSTPHAPFPSTASGPPAGARVRHVALIPAAGVGQRMGAVEPKQYLRLAGDTLLGHAVRAFVQARRVDAVAVVVAPDDPRADALAAAWSGTDPAGRAPMLLRAGGETRRDSVLGGLRALRDAPFGLRDEDRVLVHDAARPGIRPEAIDALVGALADDPVGGLLALPVVDTVKRVVDGRVVVTEPREALWLAQTPQLFAAGLLQRALERHPEVTDEARAIELEGLQPRVVPGTRGNLKVTVPEDLAWLEGAWATR